MRNVMVGVLGLGALLISFGIVFFLWSPATATSVPTRENRFGPGNRGPGRENRCGAGSPARNRGLAGGYGRTGRDHRIDRIFGFAPPRRRSR